MRFKWMTPLVVAMCATSGCSQHSTGPHTAGAAGATSDPTRKQAVGLPGDPVVVGTGGGHLEVQDNNVVIADGESSNKVSMLLTSVVTAFNAYEHPTSGFHKNIYSLQVRQGTTVMAQITRVGSQFHWQLADSSNNLYIPDICRLGTAFPTVDPCMPATSYGIPKVIYDLRTQSNVTLWATWEGQAAYKLIDHAEIQ